MSRIVLTASKIAKSMHGDALQSKSGKVKAKGNSKLPAGTSETKCQKAKQGVLL